MRNDTLYGVLIMNLVIKDPPRLPEVLIRLQHYLGTPVHAMVLGRD